ncbi:hypothetical protein LEX56_002537 [Salmonella enterica]|uniref:Uncharacterized protein n=1 Tax=Salmonella enterica TaxID=28901 RepID=A0A5U2K8S7_SALER|nr:MULTISPECIES: hypothetical protein [Enterobacteriaceae]EAM2837584.1 hypothetical protein [Salmonella enterica]EBP3893915.1 hypothetical protein [Salmonella enterica subsp. enterica]EEE5078068.1 hypothetical protein [Salmonella enterica subsp. enterica serovar Thompson]ELJ2720532.1 hypothetical protein [Salmonella enterica subsp. diarizonae]POV68830.1 hypothetical protein C3404_01015 [Citrobacter freundii complex sp. CFNIH11]
MDTFYRDYRLTVGIGNQAVIIEPPITVSFKALETVDKKSLGKLSVSINGLKPSTRLQLLKSEDEEKYIPVRLEVGYDGKLRQVFQGSVKSGAVKREGAIHIVSLECEDGGHDYINAFTSRTVRGKDQVVDSVLQDMPNTKKGSVTKQQALIRPKVLVGSSSKILTDTLAPDESFFIKDERVHILKANEVTSGNIPVVNARSGLLNTPQATKISAQDDGGKKAKMPTNEPDTDPAGKKDTDSSTLAKSSKGQIVFDTKLNPMLVIGGLCAVESVTNPALNGVYKIYQIETSGQNNGAAWYQKVVCQPAGNYSVVN